MALPNNVNSFQISVDGSKTGEKWLGSFKSKILLSQADELAIDRRRRELLGPGSQDASVAALQRATIFAELFVRLLEAPSWWTESKGGLDLVDDEPVAEIYNECQKAETNRLNELKAKANKTQEALKETAKEG